MLDLSVLNKFSDKDNYKKETLGSITKDIKKNSFMLPNVTDLDNFQKASIEFFKPKHGTTTLGFMFQHGIILAVDSRATMGSYIASIDTNKVIAINDRMLGTMAGGAADCKFWERYLGIQCRLYELNNGKKITIKAASKLLSNIVYRYKGMGLSMGTMVAGWDINGPGLYYVDSEGLRTKENVLSVGSGCLYAYSVLDNGYKWELNVDEAVDLAKKSIYHATFRDSSSGGTVSVYFIKKDGWTKLSGDDVTDLHYQYFPETEKISLD